MTYNLSVNGNADPETEAELAKALNGVLQDEKWGVQNSYMSGSGFGTELHTDNVNVPGNEDAEPSPAIGQEGQTNPATADAPASDTGSTGSSPRTGKAASGKAG